MATFMAPCDPNNESIPISIDFISHKRNSHTFCPKIIGQPIDDYNDAINGGLHLVDFPGMFDTKGTVIEIAMLMALQKIIKRAKSVKIIVLVSAGVFDPSNTKLIKEIRSKLEFMFDKPEENVVIAVTKAHMFQDFFDEDEVLDIAQGN